MRRLLFIFSILCGFGSWGQTAGITVITHGFDAFAGTSLSGIDSWIEHGYEVAEVYNSYHSLGPKATVLVNDPISGLWKIHDDPRNGNANINAEIIFVYDWTKYSNNFLFYNRYLEAAADNLFALLTQPSISYGNNSSVILGSTISGSLLASKEKHFIGHSRGAILLLQVAHRIKNFFPDTNIEHLTLLDPHPAGMMKDVLKIDDLLNPISNLPCVLGYADNCLLGLCSKGVYSENTNYVNLKIPVNVVKADCYYRTQGTTYEPGIYTQFQLAPFSGVPVVGLPFNRELNNTKITQGMGTGASGGAHSGVHVWYFKTANRWDENSNRCFSKLNSNQTGWFNYSTGDWMISNTENPNGEDCTDTGYNYSRLRGGYNSDRFANVPLNAKISLDEMNQQLNARLGTNLSITYPETLINGDFSDATKAKIGGWFNGKNYYSMAREYEMALDPILKMPSISANVNAPMASFTHNYFYIPTDKNALKVSCKIQLSEPVNIKITFKNNNGAVVSTQEQLISSTTFNDFYFDIQFLNNKVGSFSVETTGGTNSVIFKSFSLENSFPQVTPPTSLNAIKMQNKVILGFEKSLNNVVNGFIIERSLSQSGGFQSIGQVNTSENTFTDLNTTYSTVYYYRIKSGNQYSSIVSAVPYTPGITVITHGLAPQGVIDNAWLENARALRNRLSTQLGTNKGATVYINNPQTGRWKLLSGENGIGSQSEELIFLYDWAAKSDIINRTGFLESGADELFSMLMNPTVEFSNGGTVNLNSVAGDLISSKNTHFIGHSRGTALMLQLLYRLRNYVSEFNLDRLTLLDPHPAGIMGDVKRQNISGSPENLPGIYGTADGCGNIVPLLCEQGNQSVKYRIPDNVLSAESYYRQDYYFEPAIGSGPNDWSLSPFSGVEVLGIGNYAHILDNATMGPGNSSPHSNLQKWYFDTVDPNRSTYTNWFNSEVGTFMANENRLSTGFNKKLNNSITTIPLQELDNLCNFRTGRRNGLETVFGGHFDFDSPAGWYTIGNLRKFPVINENLNSLELTPTFTIDHATSAIHNVMYFPATFHSLSLDLKVDLGTYAGQTKPLLIIEFYNANGIKINQVYRSTLSTVFNRVHFGIPTELLGKNGTFKLVFGDNGSLNEYNAADLKMIIDNIELSNENLVVSAPAITVNQTTILGGQSISLNATGCETGIVHWTTGQTGQSVNYTPIETQGYAAYCEIDGFYSTPSNALVVTVNYNQTMSASEYFFDTDPGYGNGSVLTFSGSSALINQTFNINLVPHNLSQGIHTFNVRVKDSNDKWSLTHTKTFLILGSASSNGLNNIEKVEYFIDSLKQDLSNLININVTPDGDLIAVPLSINLPLGIHTVSFRVKDSEEKSSLFHSKTFLVLGMGVPNGQNSIVKCESFFDNDPEEGNRIQQNIVLDTNNQVIIPITINLPQGIHTVSFRVKDANGLWSSFHTKTFLILGSSVPNGQNKIVKGEYFFDNNDDVANRVQENISLDANNQVIIPITINLPQGIHTVSFRVKDANGLWSLFHTKTFLVIGTGNGNEAISQVEYFIDNEPGFNNGTQVPFTLSNNQMIFDINLSSLSQGVHVLYVRVKTNHGQWSLTHAKVFVVMPNTESAIPIDRIEYFIDTPDPGQGNATNVSYVNNSEGGVTANFDIAIGQLSTGVHQLTVRARNSNGNWSPVKNLGFDVLANNCSQMYSIKSGSWNDPRTWSCGRVPTSSDNVVITATHTVDVPMGNHQVKNITQNGFLNFEQDAVILVLGGN